MFGYKLLKQSDYDKLLVNNNKIVVKEVTHTSVVQRLEHDTYIQLEKLVGNVLVTSTTSDIEAGFKLGAQHVLQKLRDGYVISRSQ